MSATYKLFEYRQIKEAKLRNDLDKSRFYKPTRISAFAVKLNANGARTLVDNPNDYQLKYTLDKFDELESVYLEDYKEETDETADKPQLLKINGEIDAFLGQILKNRTAFLSRPVGPVRTTAKKPTAADLGDGLVNLSLNDRKLLAFDFVGLRSTFACLLNCQYANDAFTVYAELFEGNIYLQLEKVKVRFRFHFGLINQVL